MEAPMAVVEEATGITTEVKIMKKRKRDCVMICEEAKEEVGIFFINKIDMKTVHSVSSKELKQNERVLLRCCVSSERRRLQQRP